MEGPDKDKCIKASLGVHKHPITVAMTRRQDCSGWR